MSGWEIEKQKMHSLDVLENNNGWFSSFWEPFCFASFSPLSVQSLYSANPMPTNPHTQTHLSL